MKVKTKAKSGGLTTNHNSALLRTPAKSPGLEDQDRRQCGVRQRSWHQTVTL
jgi:hypothetical protein